MVLRMLFRRNPLADAAVQAWTDGKMLTFAGDEGPAAAEVASTANLVAATDDYDLLMVHEAFCDGATDLTSRAPLLVPLLVAPPTTPLLFNLARAGARAYLRHQCTLMPPRCRQEYMRATLMKDGTGVRVASGRLPVGQPVAEQLTLLGMADADVMAVTPACVADAPEVYTQMSAAGFHMAATYADADACHSDWSATGGGLWVRWTLADAVRYELRADGTECLTLGHEGGSPAPPPPAASTAPIAETML